MATLEDVTAEVADLKNTLLSIKSALDVVAQKLSSIPSGAVSQEQLDDLSNSLKEVQALAGEAKTEAEGEAAS